jgi:hypothetical protein
VLFRSVAAPAVEETPVAVKSETADTQEIIVAGPSSADTTFMDVYSQRGVTRAGTWTSKLQVT